MPVVRVFDFNLHHRKTRGEIQVAFRIIANGQGAELIMTVLRPAEIPNHLYDNVVVWLRNGLSAFRRVLEDE